MTIEGSNRLAVLAGQIRDAHDACRSAGEIAAARAVEVGELLLEAKASLPHGAWLP